MIKLLLFFLFLFGSYSYVKRFKNEIKVLLSIHLEKNLKKKDASRRLHTHFDVFFIHCLDICRPFFVCVCSFPSLLLSRLLNLSVFFLFFFSYPMAYSILSFFSLLSFFLFFSSFKLSLW